MDTKAFEDSLAQDGFVEIGTKSLEPDFHLDAHNHPFDARVLIIDGEFQITVDGACTTYKPGDSFTMAAGREHIEDAGPNGVTFLAGRRYK